MIASDLATRPTPAARTILPTLDDVASLPWDPALAGEKGIYGFNSRDIRSRPFNLLRSRLHKFYRSKGWRTFGVVSATPGVGKSFIAANIAAAASRSPWLTTYLCDLDLRRGSIAENFGAPQPAGVREFLEGDTGKLRATAFRPAGERLIVLPTDAAPVHSAELLSGAQMASLVQAMRSDVGDALFICDLPPVFANDDASIVTAQLDAYILVVEDGQTTKKQIRDSLDVLDEGTCAGIVLNRYSGGLISDSYGYSYGTEQLSEA